MTASDSRFKFTDIINVNGVETYGKWVPPAFLSGAGVQYIVSNAFAGRPDLISQDVYNTPKYFWAIVAFNNPVDVLDWPKSNDVIGIPDISLILSEF